MGVWLRADCRAGGDDAVIDLSGEPVPRGLPPGRELVARGREIAASITTGWARYCRERSVRSERDYKEACAGRDEITYYINLGLKTWLETRAGLEQILAACRDRDLRVDRVSLTADRRMGLPPDARRSAIEETGIMFWTPQDWHGAANDLDVEPILNDHAVGSPASVENACAAIEAGFGYIGNLSQQAYRYPGWPSDADQMIATVTAMGVIAAKKADGVVLDSYIDDGFCASFHDAATSLGWCLFHRHIAELVDVAYAPSYGSTFADPALKQAFGLALDRINVSRVPPSLVHGDTNSLEAWYSPDRNAAIITSDIYFTIASQLAHPTGAAVHPTPLTEPSRIPTVEDIIQSLEIGREAERRARATRHLIDWRPVYALRDQILAGGERVFRNLMDGLALIGVDTADPLALLIATKRLGADEIERAFGSGEPDDGYPRGRVPVVPTDTLRRTTANRQRVIDALAALTPPPRITGLRVVAASGDIHEYGLYVLTGVLRSLGCAVTDLGTSVDNTAVAAAAAETAADVVALSTYNGMAASLTRDLLRELARRGLRTRVYVGGRLTEDLNGVKNVDVARHIAELGAVPCASVEEMVADLSRSVAGRD
jgi:methylmalonyl-CoA mutase cobalamin-binding subunit